MRGSLLGRWLTVFVVLCLAAGCSSEADEESPAMSPPAIEMPEEPTEVASTETPSTDEPKAAVPGDQPQNRGGKPEDTDGSNESTGKLTAPK